jgi:NADPH:quinone reductase-like Zn-dependent oxidoreductase
VTVQPQTLEVTAATDPLDNSVLPTAAQFIPVRPDGAQLERIARDVAEGSIKVIVSARFLLVEAARAHELIEKSGVKGKIILTI